MTTLYETLGVSPDASPDDIKKAYRRQAAALHPDREGGDHAAMQAVNKAYAVLSDPEKRQRYDDTGDDGDAPPLEVQARSALAQMFNEVVDKLDRGSDDDLNYTSLPAAIDKELHGIRDKNAQTLRQLRRRIKQRQQAIKRLKHKGAGPNIAAEALAGAVTHLEGEISKIEGMQKLIDEVLRLLGEYEYEVDERPAGVRASPSIFTESLQEALRRAGYPS